ncbi:MAG: N(4)-(beta-N-acetylglucosaminyl)-L-asparaginase [Bryobacteraceae bacterium]
MITRRGWLAGVSALPAFAQAKPKNITIASDNGLRACARAMEILSSGGDTLDAVVAGVNINEEDPEDSSVGYGGLPNEEGVVELDACVMHGPTRRAGSVASIRNIKTPSKVAKLVMEQTDHIMLVGEGALRFAKAYGFREENLLTEKSRVAWLVWKRSLKDSRGHSNWSALPRADEATLAWAMEMAAEPITGTINCLSLNAKGEMSGVTTTSGLAWKIPGRVGDSPIIGAGLYVDQDIGAAGSTGRGEEAIRVAGAHSVVENMRHGMPAREACLDVLRRVARNFNGDETKLSRFDLNFYALRKDGDYAGASLWNGSVRQGKLAPRRFALNDGGKSRHEACVYLLERKN